MLNALPLWRMFVAAALIVPIAACDDDDANSPMGPPGPQTTEIAVIVNSTDVSVTVFAVDSPAIARTIGINPGVGQGSPVTAAARKNLALIPLGFFPAVAVVDLTTDDVSSIPLPNNSGATGVAFLNDSIAYVANPNLNSVSVVNAFSGTAVTEIPVGVFPQAVVTVGDRVFVLNAELDASFVPARSGRITVIDGGTSAVTDTIVLTGFNPAAATLGGDGMLYVINSGNFGQGDGSMSVVNPTTLQEVEHHEGFGEFPGDIAYGPGDRVYVSAFAYGIAVWDAAADTFINPPANPLIVGGNATSSGIGFDSDGMLYSLIPGDCISPSVALRFDPGGSAAPVEIATGSCPFAITFGEV